MDELLFKTDELRSMIGSETFKIVLEYGNLAGLATLSPVQASRFAEILEQACGDRILNFWLNEVDHLLGHSLGYLDEDDRQSYKDQQALLREYLGTEILSAPASSAPVAK